MCHPALVPLPLRLPLPRARAGASRLAWGWVAAFVAFVAYAAALAPPDDPALTRALVRGVFTGDYGAVDPAISAVFSALGVVPVLAATFVLRDGACRKLPAWPFALGMFALGAFALLPWLALRGLGGPRGAALEAGRVRRFLASRKCAAGIVVALGFFAAWGASRGDAAAYRRAFATTSMVNVMSIDLVVCAALVMVLVEEARRDLAPGAESALARAVRGVPLLGSALWATLVKRAP